MTNFDYLVERLAELDKAQRLRKLVPRRTDGVYLVGADGRRLMNFGGNDYLGLAAGRQQAASGKPELETGSGASPLVCGWTDAHEQLVETIADFESTESAVLFPSGYAACSGCIATLAEAGDLILSDELNHASLIDGCRLSRADRVVYPHRDTGSLEQLLTQKRNQSHRAWIVTDGVFSMDGHVAPLVELCEIAQRYDACLIVDEAHGTGVLGDSGSGVCEAMGVKDRVAIRIGTLSKAIGSQGGFVAGPQIVIDYLINRCRSLIYSTSLAPAAVSAASAAFDVIRDQPERRAHVGQLARRLRHRLSIAGRTSVQDHNQTSPLEASVPIIPVIVGEDGRATAASELLAERGFYVPAIRPPTVPEGAARLRVSLSAAHDEAMVDSLESAIASVL